MATPSEIFEYYNAGDDNSNKIYGSRWMAQTFTVADSHLLTYVKVKLFKNGSPGTITCAIKATTGGYPSGVDLATGTYDGDTLGASPGAFVQIDLTGSPILTTDKYALILKAPSGDEITNYVGWRMQFAGGYADGDVKYTDDGTSWSDAGTWDAMFEEYGFLYLSVSDTSAFADSLSIDTYNQRHDIQLWRGVASSFEKSHGSPSAMVTWYELSLGASNSTTGWFNTTYRTDTVEMLIVPRGQSLAHLGLGYHSVSDATGYTQDPRVQVGDKVATLLKTYRILHIDPWSIGDVVYYYACDLKEIVSYE